MIAIKEKIVKAYQTTRYQPLLYYDKKWYQYPQTIYLTIFILFSSINFFLKSTYQILFSVIWVVLFVIGIITVIFPLNKKRMKDKLGVEPEKRKYSHWAITEFREAQLTELYNKLLENNILIGNVKDIELLSFYEELFKNEADLFKSKEKVLLREGVILLFILPVWDVTTELVLNSGKNFIENINIVFKLLFLIYCLIYFLRIMQFWIEEILDKRYWKYIDIKRNLHNIRLNIELKNAKQQS